MAAHALLERPREIWSRRRRPATAEDDSVPMPRRSPTRAKGTLPLWASRTHVTVARYEGPGLRQCSVSPLRVVKPDNRGCSRRTKRGHHTLHNPVISFRTPVLSGNRHFHPSASRLRCGCGDKFLVSVAQVRRIYCDLESILAAPHGRTIFNDNLVDSGTVANDRSCRPIPKQLASISSSVEPKAVGTKKFLIGVQPDRA